MAKNLVCFDTSAWRGNSPAALEVKFSSAEWIWCLPETSDIELADVEGQDDRKVREMKLLQTVQFNVKTLDTPANILNAEIARVLRGTPLPDYFPLFHANDQKERSEHLMARGPAVDKALRERAVLAVRQETIAWDEIPIQKGEACRITSDQLRNRYDELKGPSTMCPIDTRTIKLGTVLEHVGDRDFEGICPALANYLWVASFAELIFRTEGSTKSATVFIDDCPIRMTPSLMTDIKIVYAYLPYVDRFATADGGQYELSRKVFSRFGERILFMGK